MNSRTRTLGLSVALCPEVLDCSYASHSLLLFFIAAFPFYLVRVSILNISASLSCAKENKRKLLVSTRTHTRAHTQRIKGDATPYGKSVLTARNADRTLGPKRKTNLQGTELFGELLFPSLSAKP